MSKRLYVGNLSWGTTNDSLKQAFSAAGNVIKADIVIDRMTNKSRGFAFVEMDDADADKAIEMFNNKELDGRTLTVNEARPREERPRRSFNDSQM